MNEQLRELVKEMREFARVTDAPTVGNWADRLESLLPQQPEAVDGVADDLATWMELPFVAHALSPMRRMDLEAFVKRIRTIEAKQPEAGGAVAWFPAAHTPAPGTADNTGVTTDLALYIKAPTDGGPNVRQGRYDHALRRYVDSTTACVIEPDTWSSPTTPTAADARDGWQPIETAPVDVEVWLFDPDTDPKQYAAKLVEREHEEGGYYWRPAEELVADVLDYELTPTHWRHLTAPDAARSQSDRSGVER